MVKLFHGIVASLPASWKTVLIVDGVDQFEDTDSPQELKWTPRHLKANVSIIVSCIDEPHQEQRTLIRAAELGMGRLDVAPLTDEERIEIIRRVPSIAAKTLDSTQIELLMANPSTKNPLFLLVALEELKGFDSFEHLNRRISQLPNPEIEEIPGGDAVRAVFQQVIVRLKEDFDAELVMNVLCFLASARKGSSENELQDLVSELSGQDDLFPVLRQLRPYLMRKGELLDFFHKGLWKAVHAHYLSYEDQRSPWNHRLACFFGGTNVEAKDINRRVIDEVQWQFRQAKEWDNLYEVMANLDMLGALVTERSRTMEAM